MKDTLTKPDTETQTDDGSGTGEPELFHYVNKNAMMQSTVEGGHVVALCGEVFPVRKVPKKGSPVCPDCKRIFDKLPK